MLLTLVAAVALRDGPGPSSVNLPHPGWTLSLRWAGTEDRLRLAYDTPDAG